MPKPISTQAVPQGRPSSRVPALVLYAIVRTDLCEPDIVRTYATAEEAQLFMERQDDDGTPTPFRIAVLSERKARAGGAR